MSRRRRGLGDIQTAFHGARLTATAIIGALANLFIRWLDGTLDVDRAELTEYCVRLLVTATDLAR